MGPTGNPPGMQRVMGAVCEVLPSTPGFTREIQGLLPEDFGLKGVVETLLHLRQDHLTKAANRHLA